MLFAGPSPSVLSGKGKRPKMIRNGSVDDQHEAPEAQRARGKKTEAREECDHDASSIQFFSRSVAIDAWINSADGS